MVLHPAWALATMLAIDVPEGQPTSPPTEPGEVEVTPTADASEPLQPAPPPAEPVKVVMPRTRVVVGVVAEDPLVEREALSQVLGGFLADTGLRHHVATLSASSDRRRRLMWASTFTHEPDVLAVFWIEGEQQERALFMFEPQRRATWVRRLETSADADATLEMLGSVLRNYCLAAGEGPPPGMDEVPPEPKPKPEPSPPPHEATPEQSPPTPPPARPRWSVEAMYAGGNLAATARWQHGGRLGLDVEWPSHWTTAITATVLQPADVAGPPVTAVWRLPLAAAVGYRFLPDGALRPYIDAALVVEPLWWRGDTTVGVEAIDGRSARIGVAPGAGVRWAITGGLGLVAHVRVDLWLLNADLVVSTEGRRDTRLRAHPVGTIASAGLFYSF